MPATTVTREVYYSPQQMFALVADVARYPDFVPNWQMVRVRPLDDTSYRTDQVVRFGPMRHTFTSTTSLQAPDRITVTSSDSPFKTLQLQWHFAVADDGGCRITLTVDFELKVRAFQAITSILSRESVVRMVDAFEHRAQDLYGPPNHVSHE
ncbi:type II toxin-antitoxin system RatA family toxin [Insolitispirillum peregrinum]|uniref:type II toxin-antitoxin system RatA family toxin n=1 Tax=Insolitispirillum peregrinum TaxID=80876 RepID=UPI00362161BF